jgi:hypothetical protein
MKQNMHLINHNKEEQENIVGKEHKVKTSHFTFFFWREGQMQEN